MKRLPVLAVFLLFLLAACDSELPPSPPAPGGEGMAGQATGIQITQSLPAWAQPISYGVSISKNTFYPGETIKVAVKSEGEMVVWSRLYYLVNKRWEDVRAKKPSDTKKGWSLASETEWAFNDNELGTKYFLVYSCRRTDSEAPWECGKWQVAAYQVVAQPAAQPTVQPTPQPTTQPTLTPIPSPPATEVPSGVTPSPTLSPSPTPTFSGELIWKQTAGWPTAEMLRCADSISDGAQCLSADLGAKCARSSVQSTGTISSSGLSISFSVFECMRKPVCGNSQVEYGEQCDGSVEHGACANCQITCDSGYTPSQGKCVPSVCGNNVKDPGEDCDGTVPHGTCSNCKLRCDDLYVERDGGCVPYCGNNVKQESEQCDGPVENGKCDKCFIVCNEWYVSKDDKCVPSCGDNVKQAWEACDGIDVIPNGKCSADCKQVTCDMGYKFGQGDCVPKVWHKTGYCTVSCNYWQRCPSANLQEGTGPCMSGACIICSSSTCAQGYTWSCS